MFNETFDFKSATYSEVVQLVEQACAAIALRGIRFTTSSALHKLFADARKLEKRWQDSNQTPTLPMGINAVYAEKIARVILELGDSPGIAEALQRIAGNDVNLSNRLKSQGKDALWELALLATLKHRGVDAELIDPPDIVANFGMGSYSIACKKIYEPKSVDSRLRDGAKQIRKSGHSGFIAINIDDMLPGDHILVSQTPDSALDILSRKILEFFEEHRNSMEKIAGKQHVDGVLISASTISDIKSTSTRLNLTTTFNCFPFHGSGIAKERFYAMARVLSATGNLKAFRPKLNIAWPVAT